MFRSQSYNRGLARSRMQIDPINRGNEINQPEFQQDIVQVIPVAIFQFLLSYERN